MKTYETFDTYDKALFLRFFKEEQKKAGLVGTTTHEVIERSLRRVIPEYEAALQVNPDDVFEIMTKLIEDVYLRITSNSEGALKPDWAAQ